MYVEKTLEAAELKYSLLSRNVWLFTLKSLLGGMFIVFGVIASCATANIFYGINPGYATLASAITFTLALLTIVFLGGELFTSGVFVMAVGLYDKKFSLGKVIKVWGTCYLGNLIAIVFFLSLYCITNSYPQAGYTEFITKIVDTKLNQSIPQLLYKGMFCNFAVCCAYYGSIRMTTDVGKFLMIFVCIFAFVVSGFEHCIANLGYFTIGYFIVPGFSMVDALRNIFFATMGNIIGGAIVLALPVYLLERKFD